MATYDLILRGATIFDGSGNDRFEGDVAVVGERIERVGEVTGRASREVNIEGLALSPGFIDVHTHDDFAALMHPDMGFKVHGGVTSCIVGNCGMGVAPWEQATAAGFGDTTRLPIWEGFGGYLALLENRPPSVNIGVLAGHGTIRRAVMRLDKRPPRTSEMNRMKSILLEGMDAGILGLSSGLIYEPSRFASTLELIQLASEMRGTNALYTTHMRDEGPGLLASVREAIEIGEQAGVGVQISHHKAAGKSSWGLVNQSLELIETAQQRGLDVHADQYPYTAGSTGLAAVMQHGSFDLPTGTLHEATAADVVIASTEHHPDWEGKSIATLASDWHLGHQQAAEKVLAEEPRTTVVIHSISEDDVRTILRHPSTLIGSDGIPTLEGRPHPRLFNTFARVLGHYARDLGVLGMEEAIAKMTSRSAIKFSLQDRGEIRQGAFADLVVFNPSGILDQGTFEEPNRYPVGIHHVFVNGKQVIDAGTHTGARTGRTLRRVD